MATDTAREYAARQTKAARWSALFVQHGVSAAIVERMGLQAPEWAKLAAAVRRETGKRLLVPHSQATIDAIVQNLRWYEEGAAANLRRTTKSTV